ncbi:uncharacterized protein [Gossypium hirsutum]|uniref:DNA/RNA polymerases superfamily protein n=1 Tax=Gossypium hirsutum TaxID=3635 RepID=A0ABM3A8G3_GOSHI|nr:uncharacterized protein LOC121218268 [Gossypium hirsutum]
MARAEDREHQVEVLDRLRQDIGSAHSYVASTVSETLGFPFESTSSEITVVSPLGQFIRVSKLFRDVLLEVQGTVFLADLMELPFEEFDLILGMGWLVKHRVSLDCATKKVVLKTEEDIEGKEVSKKVDSSVKDIQTVRDFSDVFLEELSGLPPSREVKFGIELILGTALMSIAPYRMASEELTELKVQIQELLDHGFVHPGVFPWGALVLKRRYNKDVY